MCCPHQLGCTLSINHPGETDNVGAFVAESRADHRSPQFRRDISRSIIVSINAAHVIIATNDVGIGTLCPTTTLSPAETSNVFINVERIHHRPLHVRRFIVSTSNRSTPEKIKHKCIICQMFDSAKKRVDELFVNIFFLLFYGHVEFEQPFLDYEAVE